MPRGRPRLYKTPEEQANTNRAKSKRSYYKKKAALASNHKRSPRFRAEQSKTTLLEGAVKDKARVSSDPTDLKGWTSLAARTGKEFNSLTKNSVRLYLDSLYNHYTNNYRTDIFSNAVIEMQALHKTMERCHHAVLNLAGVGKELRVVQEIGGGVHEALKCLEELECYASFGKAEIIEMQRTKQLMFQSLNY
ncbi:hypothetical protein BDN71DRAFT_1510817 [Pleurotus eryngii]|uniref:Uncharacterized protein n=1 Tax=Pleurotus eryngii TaxID=5323 RepID=A0A9P5ZSA0_PLEER|nr:hypothetical protein BDN71DRAFT_1510817 [Pleurotus eryngii]